LNTKVRQHHGAQRNKPNSPHGPPEPDLRQQLAHHTWEHQAARGGAAGGAADGEGAAPSEVCREDGDGGAEQAAVAEAHADALREEEMPVARAQGRGKDADDLEDGAGNEQGAEVARVGEAAGEGADEEEEEDLDGADPGYV
jgi:hypothetical protein